jgi:hypothetical protein
MSRGHSRRLSWITSSELRCGRKVFQLLLKVQVSKVLCDILDALCSGYGVPEQSSQQKIVESSVAAEIITYRRDAYRYWLQIHTPDYPRTDSGYTSQVFRSLPAPLYYTSLYELAEASRLLLERNDDVHA